MYICFKLNYEKKLCLEYYLIFESHQQKYKLALVDYAYKSTEMFA